MRISERAQSEGFNLVDEYGDIIEDRDGFTIRGLLTYHGGTVCDDGFGNSEADVICREMGYHHASSWNSGSFFNVQNVLDIKLDNVNCEGGSWSTCTYLTYDNCDHSEDVFLTCVTGEIIRLGTYQDGVCYYQLGQFTLYSSYSLTSLAISR